MTSTLAKTAIAAATAPVHPSLIAGAPTVTSIKGKKRRLTGAELKQRTELARKMTGYGASSPIFGKQTPDVLVLIDAALGDALAALSAGDDQLTLQLIDQARAYAGELQKRIATRKIAFAR